MSAVPREVSDDPNTMADADDLFAQLVQLSKNNVLVSLISEPYKGGEASMTNEFLLSHLRTMKAIPHPSKGDMERSFKDVLHRLETQVIAHLAQVIERRRKAKAAQDVSLEDVASILEDELDPLQPLSSPATPIPTVVLPVKEGGSEGEERALTTVDSIKTRVKVQVILRENKYGELENPQTGLIFELGKDHHYYAVARRRGEKRIPLSPEDVEVCKNNAWKYKA